MDSASLISSFIKYSNELEELLHCPICYELPTDKVPMCPRGHHVCMVCFETLGGIVEMRKCPICQFNFNGTQNFLIQNISSKLQEMKYSLLDSSQQTLNNTIYVQARDDFYHKSASSFGKSKVDLFACQIRFCDHKLKYFQIIPHLRYYHEENFKEVATSKFKTFTQRWTVEYTANKIFDQAICAPNLGIFFFSLSIDENGEIYETVQIANSLRSKRKFKYKINLSNGNRFLSHKGLVTSCRLFQSNILEEGMNFLVNRNQISRLLKADKTFYCSLSVTLCKRKEGEFKSGSFSKIFNNRFFKNMFVFFVLVLLNIVICTLLLYKKEFFFYKII